MHVFRVRIVSEILRTVVVQIPIDVKYLATFRARTVEGRGNQRMDFLIICFHKSYFQIAPGPCRTGLQ